MSIQRIEKSFLIYPLITNNAIYHDNTVNSTEIKHVTFSIKPI